MSEDLGINKLVDSIRTHREMQEVYRERIERGDGDKPYVLEYERDGQRLIFFGARHSSEADDVQWVELERLWQKFVESDHLKVAICEGSVRPVAEMTREESIRTNGDSGVICWLAGQADVLVISPEPDRVQEIDFLKEQGHTPEQIITYYFARQMHQWAKQDYQVSPDWKACAEDVLARYASIYDWGNVSLGLEALLDHFEAEVGAPFSVDDTHMLSKVSDPSQNPVASSSSRFRDRELYKAISEKWHQGDDIFVVFGSGHAIVLEPALEKLVQNR